ncbi:hypothetical protein [Rhizobium terricola]|nr:hypothetical protein [Rhizobium terricola]
MFLKPPSLAKARDKDEHIGEVSIAPSRTGLREFAREEIGEKAAAGGRHSDPGSTAADFDLHLKSSKLEMNLSKLERTDISRLEPSSRGFEKPVPMSSS